MRVARLDRLGASWNVEVIVQDGRTGRPLWRQRQHNLVVTAGRNMIRDSLYGDTVAGITHFAAGTGSTAVAAGDVALVTQVLRDVITQRIKASGALQITYFLATTVANGNTLAEVGLFNAASGPTMYARAVLSTPIVKTVAIAATFNWTLSWQV